MTAILARLDAALSGATGPNASSARDGALRLTGLTSHECMRLSFWIAPVPTRRCQESW
jgi:hypothetical protein